ncbi:MAG: exodeoxyribonuclease VII large subunit [Pseudomonadota bacterium]
MAEAATNTPEYSVSEISSAVKRTVEDAFGYVRVRGELGRVSRPASGHVYTDLKDDRSVLSAVMWRGTAQKLTFRPEEGLEVVATGRLTTFPGQSRYQLIIDRIEPAGVGALMKLLEERKKKLAAEGLFDEERKKPLPFLPKVIGVVTSPSGAVIRDILHRLSDRTPAHVLVWPVRVQGETSAAEVARAIEGFDALDEGADIPRPDVLIVARGGGSLEDLWGFNEEIVARAAADCSIPLVSAIGHETDWSLLDYVADVRAPTPTGAAEMVVPVRAELVLGVDDLGRRLVGASLRKLENSKRDLRNFARAMPSMDALLSVPQQRLDQATLRLSQALINATATHRTRMDRTAGRLSPRLVLSGISHRHRSVEVAADRVFRAHEGTVRTKKQRFALQGARVTPRALEKKLSDSAKHLERAGDSLLGAQTKRVQAQAQRLAQAEKLLAAFNYKRVLDRGYAVIRNADGVVLKGKEAVKKAGALKVELSDGTVAAQVGGAGTPRRLSDARPKPKQETLFD